MLGPSSISDKPGKSAMGMDLVPVYAEAAGPKVTIDPTVVQNMGVRTAEVTRGPLTKTVRTVGLLKSPEPGMHDVSLKVGGWIDKLYADQEGMHVMKGEPLFELYSQDLQVAEEELISAVKAEQSLPADAAPNCAAGSDEPGRVGQAQAAAVGRGRGGHRGDRQGGRSRPRTFPSAARPPGTWSRRWSCRARRCSRA